MGVFLSGKILKMGIDYTCAIGIYGGSFDPPHIGHVDVISQIMSRYNIHELNIVPCWRHAFDKKMSDYRDRYLMSSILAALMILI